MHLQKIYDTISDYNETRILRLRHIFKQYQFSEDDFNDIYHFIYINRLDINWYKIINEYYEINEKILDIAIFFDIEYFKAICKSANIDLSYNQNTLITHFLINEEFEGAVFLYGFKEVKDNFEPEYFSDLVGEEVVNKFMYIKNIKNF